MLRHHVLRDLEPYICTFGNCSRADFSFESRTEWIEHEMQDHRKEWCCKVSSHPPHSNSASFRGHMRDAHGADTVSVHAFERFVQSGSAICPLCFRQAGKIMTHLARHMEQIALYVLGGNNERDS